jgi:hypothetical protein
MQDQITDVRYGGTSPGFPVDYQRHEQAHTRAMILAGFEPNQVRSGPPALPEKP